MTIQEQFVSDVALMRVSGRVTLTDGTAVFEQTIRRLIEGGHHKLILDLAEVPYIDSTALGIILRTHATVIRRGGALKLVHVRGHVHQLLELAKLVSVLEIVDSEAQALAGFRAAPSAH